MAEKNYISKTDHKFGKRKRKQVMFPTLSSDYSLALLILLPVFPELSLSADSASPSCCGPWTFKDWYPKYPDSILYYKASKARSPPPPSLSPTLNISVAVSLSGQSNTKWANSLGSLCYKALDFLIIGRQCFGCMLNTSLDYLPVTSWNNKITFISNVYLI